MRIIYTFLFIFSFIFCVQAQDAVLSPSSGSKNTSFTTGFTAVDFSINKIYPNPVKDKVTLDVQADQPGDVQLSLFNILGSVVKQWEPVYLTGGDQKIILDLTSFQPGIYFLRMNKSNQVVTQILKKI